MLEAGAACFVSTCSFTHDNAFPEKNHECSQDTRTCCSAAKASTPAVVGSIKGPSIEGQGDYTRGPKLALFSHSNLGPGALLLLMLCTANTRPRPPPLRQLRSTKPLGPCSAALLPLLSSPAGRLWCPPLTRGAFMQPFDPLPSLFPAEAQAEGGLPCARPRCGLQREGAACGTSGGGLRGEERHEWGGITEPSADAPPAVCACVCGVWAGGWVD